MTYSELKKPIKKPKFYENHENILDQTLLEPHNLTLYLHENMLFHFDNIEDVANCLEVYSEMDSSLTKINTSIAS